MADDSEWGLRLDVYGFSVIGDRLAQAATTCVILAGQLLSVGIVMYDLSASEQKRIRNPPEPR